MDFNFENDIYRTWPTFHSQVKCHRSVYPNRLLLTALIWREPAGWMIKMFWFVEVGHISTIFDGNIQPVNNKSFTHHFRQVEQSHFTTLQSQVSFSKLVVRIRLVKLTRWYELPIITQLVSTQAIRMRSTRRPRPNGNKFELYLQLIDLYTTLDIFPQLEYVLPYLFRGIFGYHDRLRLWFSFVACLRRSTWCCMAVHHMSCA